MSSPSILVILTGPPGVGKSALARGIASNLGVPCLSRDALKEILFDVLGTEDRETSRRHGQAAFRLLAHLIDELLGARASLVVDSNLSAGPVAEAIAKSARQREARLLHLKLTAPPETILARYEARARSGERHPGHQDVENLEEMRKRLATEPYPYPALGGDELELDTSQPHPLGRALKWIETRSSD